MNKRCAIVYKAITNPHVIPTAIDARIRRFWRRRKRRIEVQRSFSRAPTILVSYPKSGRTWLRVVVGKAIHTHYNIDDPSMVFLTSDLIDRAGLAPLHIAHEEWLGRALISQPYNKPLIDSPSIKTLRRSYRGKRVILLIRDIRDVLVSAFYHRRYRTEQFSGSISDYIRAPDFGIRQAALHYKAWHDNLDVLDDYLLIRYEDLHLRQFHAIRGVLTFLGVDDVAEDVIKESILFGSLDNMQTMERQGRFTDAALKRTGVATDNALKARRGKMSGYGDDLNETDLEYIDDVVRNLSAPLGWVYFDRDSINEFDITTHTSC